MEYELVYGLPKAEVLAQMAEELTEAAQAALKLRRAMDGANPTPISVDTGMNNLIEELADCQLSKCYTDFHKCFINVSIFERLNVFVTFVSVCTLILKFFIY